MHDGDEFDLCLAQARQEEERRAISVSPATSPNHTIDNKTGMCHLEPLALGWKRRTQIFSGD